jgi:hypothetical protein
VWLRTSTGSGTAREPSRTRAYREGGATLRRVRRRRGFAVPCVTLQNELFLNLDTSARHLFATTGRWWHAFQKGTAYRRSPDKPPNRGSRRQRRSGFLLEALMLRPPQAPSLVLV